MYNKKNNKIGRAEAKNGKLGPSVQPACYVNTSADGLRIQTGS